LLNAVNADIHLRQGYGGQVADTADSAGNARTNSLVIVLGDGFV
jgi:hypothetical protein